MRPKRVNQESGYRRAATVRECEVGHESRTTWQGRVQWVRARGTRVWCIARAESERASESERTSAPSPDPKSAMEGGRGVRLLDARSQREVRTQRGAHAEEQQKVQHARHASSEQESTRWAQTGSRAHESVESRCSTKLTARGTRERSAQRTQRSTAESGARAGVGSRGGMVPGAAGLGGRACREPTSRVPPVQASPRRAHALRRPQSTRRAGSVGTVESRRRRGRADRLEGLEANTC